MRLSFGYFDVYIKIKVIFGAILILSTIPVSAYAQVIEIIPGGFVTYDRPTVFTRDSATPFSPSPPPPISKPTQTPPARTQHLDEAASWAGVSPALVEAVAWRESHFKAGVVSSAGAIGEMQLMPATARSLGVDPTDSRQNYFGGALYLSAMLRRYDGDIRLALAAYNAGPAAVDRYRDVPPFKETQNYVAAILDRLSQRTSEEP